MPSRRLALLVLALAGAALGSLGADRSPLLLQSQESRTREGTAVFNRIAWTPGWNQDVWVMQQSHAGLTPPFENWDRLAIVVDKTQTPKIARFYQLEPGQLAWEPSAKLAPLRASCFMCHSNGPRAIRPEPEQSAVVIRFLDRARLLLWNLRVKTYGRVVIDPLEVRAHAAENPPLRHAGPFENEKLPVLTCAKCHNERFWGRGALTRQNFMSIGFMVKKGFMPPPGFALDKGESVELTRFIQGFPI